MGFQYYSSEDFGIFVFANISKLFCETSYYFALMTVFHQYHIEVFLLTVGLQLIIINHLDWDKHSVKEKKQMLQMSLEITI